MECNGFAVSTKVLRPQPKMNWIRLCRFRRPKIRASQTKVERLQSRAAGPQPKRANARFAPIRSPTNYGWCPSLNFLLRKQALTMLPYRDEYRARSDEGRRKGKKGRNEGLLAGRRDFQRVNRARLRRHTRSAGSNNRSWMS